MNKLSDDTELNYAQFLSEAVDTGIIWSLTTTDDDESEFVMVDSETDPQRGVMLFFSNIAFAEALCVEEWSECSPRAIDLDEFIDKWLPGMQGDGYLVGVNWNDALDGFEQEPLELSLELLETD
ncbi:DUF2750 domain-containing protein [Pleionea litopenaei]|uniref:DUF2750 domain-containing protein n=1 Tax=Pleionea litopenaei TaxID=3070815 RepID=A0AA51RVU1_9GAMM|nr:DUF2750 domain-containing protein [Pleionea sp. HL-JVS1]WMS88500.1 DUF2750 domain-containing protein [Pleionea sp. HL-JVS1]